MKRVRQSLTYLSVGALCALLNNVIMIGGDILGFHYAMLNLLAFFIVNSLGYVLHAHATFAKERCFGGYVRFMLGCANGFLLSMALFFLFCTILQWPMVIASPLVTVLLLVYNILIARWVFIHRTTP